MPELIGIFACQQVSVLSLVLMSKLKIIFIRLYFL